MHSCLKRGIKICGFCGHFKQSTDLKPIFSLWPLTPSKMSIVFTCFFWFWWPLLRGYYFYSCLCVCLWRFILFL